MIYKETILVCFTVVINNRANDLTFLAQNQLNECYSLHNNKCGFTSAIAANNRTNDSTVSVQKEHEFAEI